MPPRSYKEHFDLLVSSTREVLEMKDGPLPRRHGWPRNPDSDLFRGRRPSDMLASVVELVGTLRERGAMPGDDFTVALLSSFVHEVWLGEQATTADIEGADTVAAVDAMFGPASDEERRAAVLQHMRDANVAGPERITRKVVNLYSALAFLLGPDFRSPPEGPQLSVELIKATHAIVGGDGLIEHAGSYRTENRQSRGQALVYLHPAMIEKRVETLVAATNAALAANLGIGGVVAVGTVFFSEFLLTHPFSNGNGRTARLLLNNLLRDVALVPFTMCGHFTGLEGRAASEAHERERRLYIEVLSMRNDKQTPPSVLAAYILESIERVLRRRVPDDGLIW